MATPRRRRILVLTPRDPYPIVGGDRLRIHRLCRELAQHYDLTLLTLCASRGQHGVSPPGDGLFKAVHRVVLPRWRSFFNVAKALAWGDVPLQVAYYNSPAFREAAEALAPEHDAVLAHLVRTAPYAESLPLVRVLEMTDAISMSMKRVRATSLGYFDLRSKIYAVEADRLGAYEQRAVGKFDIVGLNSDADRSFLLEGQHDGHPHVMVIPNGTDAPVSDPPPQARRIPGEIVFLGNLHSLQNFDAAWLFARHALPLIRERRPDARLRVIGSIRNGAALRLASLPGVIVEGFVPSVPEALATARVGVCPTRIGSGMQNKILDYFGNRLAVVCSPAALQGFAARPGEHLVLAESPEDWAAKVLHLLDNEDDAQSLADAGRELACRRYRWDRCVFPLLGVLDGLLDRQDPERTVRPPSDLTASSWATATAIAPRSRSSAT